MAKLESYFSIPTSSGAVWCGKDAFVFLNNTTGFNQVWMGYTDGREPLRLTDMKNRVGGLHVSPAGDVFFMADEGGNEQMQLYMLKGAAGEPISITANPKARHHFGGLRADGRTVVYSGTGRDPACFDICAKDLETGEERIVFENTPGFSLPAALSPDGKYLLFNKMHGMADNRLWLVDLDTGKGIKIDEKSENAQYTSPAWDADSKGFYFLTDAGSEFEYLAHYDLESGAIRKVYEEEWDLETLEMSPDGRYLAMLINRDGYSFLEVYDTQYQCFLNIPKPPKGVMGYYGLSWSREGRRLLFSLSSGKRPANVWLLDLEGESLRQVYGTPYGEVDPDTLVEPTLHHYQSYDGLTVPYWFYKAPGAGDGPVPVALEIHGGPEGQERPMYAPLLQYLLSQGVSVIAPNVRGSVGYGKRYHHLDDVEKRMDSVHDLQSLVQHLVAEKIAIPGRIAIMGGSYGGFMTLAGLTEYPDLWAAGVDTVGISNFETFLENTADYRRAHRECEYGSLKEHREILRAVSPIHKVDRIVAPLMVIHGKNDPRVPVGEAEQIVESLKRRGVAVKFLCYPDEGHGLAKRKNQLDCYPQVAAFLKEHLGI